MNDFLTNFFKDPKDKQDFWIAIVVIVLFLGSIIYSIFPFSENQNPISFFEESESIENATTDNTVEGEIPTEFASLIAEKEDKAITESVMADKQLVRKIDDWIDTVETDIIVPEEPILPPPAFIPIEDDSISDSTIGTQDTIIAETEDAIVTEEDPNTATTQTTEEVAKATETEETAEATETSETTTKKETSTEKETVATTKTETESKKTEPKSTVPTKDKSTAALPKCVIIVGAFSKRHNADKVVRQLEKAKYTVHTFYRKGRLAVSVTHDCKDKKGLRTKLQNLKKTYKDAWILRR